MTPIEANVVLTRAALLDPRMKRVDVHEQADMATAWASVLTRAGVGKDAAIDAVEAHYATSREPIMVADVVALAVPPALPGIPDITAELEAEWAARPREIEAADRMRPAGGWPAPTGDADE